MSLEAPETLEIDESISGAAGITRSLKGGRVVPPGDRMRVESPGYPGENVAGRRAAAARDGPVAVRRVEARDEGDGERALREPSRRLAAAR